MEPKKNPSKDIHKRYPLHLVAGLCISCALVIGLFELEFRKPGLIHRNDEEPDDGLILINPVSEPEPKVPPVRRQRAVQVVMRPVAATIAVADEPEETEPAPAAEVAAEPIPSDEPLLLAEEMPQPVDGFAKFYKQLGRDLTYPRKAVQADVEGKVFIESRFTARSPCSTAVMATGKSPVVTPRLSG